MTGKTLNLYQGCWADWEGLILAVAMLEDHLLIRVIRRESKDRDSRLVVFRGERPMEELEQAKQVAIDRAAAILRREAPSALQWREYTDLGLLIRSL